MTPIEVALLVFVVACAVAAAALRDVLASIIAFGAFSLGVAGLQGLEAAPAARHALAQGVALGARLRGGPPRFAVPRRRRGGVRQGCPDALYLHLVWDRLAAGPGDRRK